MDGDGGGHDEDAHEKVGHRQAHHKAVGNGAKPASGQYGQYDQGVPDDGDHDEGGKDCNQDDALPGEHQIVEVRPFGGRRRLVVVIKCGHGRRGSGFGESHCIRTVRSAGISTSYSSYSSSTCPIARILIYDGYVFRQTTHSHSRSQSQSPQGGGGGSHIHERRINGA